jgi:S-adenosyl-L-methionine hydrolase (adenosine-forming)
VSIITVLTDFGLKDSYVGVMKGVILSINPKIRIVDITHDITPQDIAEASFALEEFYGYFPKNSVHLCVVDPTVGSTRRALVMRSRDRFFVGPDNGLFSLIIDDNTEIREITNNRFMLPYVSPTFHGRDVFAPASAYLSLGVRFSDFGAPVHDPVRLYDLRPRVTDEGLEGRIVRFDRFGNAISNISIRSLQGVLAGENFLITLGRMRFASLNKSYFEQPLTCLIGSSGYLEFGSFLGNFGAQTGIRKGDLVTIRTA